MASRKSDSGTSVPTTPSKWATLVCNNILLLIITGNVFISIYKYRHIL